MDMELFNELFSEIERIPMIDIHSHVDIDTPAAGDLSDIALYNHLQTELKSAGVAHEALEGSGPARVNAILPHLSKIRNTSTYWCLTQILEDVYDTGPLHEADIQSLQEKVSKTAADLNWPKTVLDKANVSRVFITADWRSRMPAKSECFIPILRLDSLINELHFPRTLDRLNEVADMTIYEAGDLKKAVNAIFEKAVAAGAVGVSASFNPQIDFEDGSRDSADRILSLVMLGQKTNRDDRRALRSYVMRVVLEACAEHRLPFQLMLGVRRPVADDRVISAFEPEMMAGYAALFSRHPRVRFDVFVSNEILAHELAVISGIYRNVYASGYWWYLSVPTHIRKMIRERIEMLPMNKSCGFFSDAYCVEWVYGKSRLIRREMAFALAEMVTEHYLTEGDAIEIAKQYFEENPKRLYRLEREGS